MTTEPVYDRIGRGYVTTRRNDPRLARAIAKALGTVQSVVNVGAGTGSYEPSDRRVIAVEPSGAMLAQRPTGAAPAVCAVAEHLPFPARSFDAALAVLTLHHWSDRAGGLRELVRVSRRRIVVFTWEPGGGEPFWLLDYFPEILALDLPRFPPSEQLAAELGGAVEITSVPIPRDCVDGFLGAWWARPHAYLEPRVRAGISCFNQIAPTAVERGIARLQADLESGTWQTRCGALCEREELDLGYRLILRRL
jgi:SAM-dependent methyltransferase